MDKTAIKNFSIWARNKLIADITYKAGLLGVTEEGIKDALPQSTQDAEFYDIGTKEPYAIHGEEIKQRKELVAAIKRKATQLAHKDAYRNVVEEVAYTWFNRLIAIRFMEVNDYMPAHIRVLSSDSKNKLEPDLVTTPFDAELEFTQAETEKIMQMKNDNQVDALFRFLFIKQCNALNAYLPKLFEKTSDYTELLLNVSVTDQDGIVYHLTHDINEADFNITDLGEDGKPTGQVEIIGWMYQYYNTEPKDEAFALLKSNVKITKERIPAATQLFTPDWIVRYMVENSVGRLWLEGHEDNNLKDGWKYYLDEAEQEADVAEQLRAIREEYKNIKPEEIKVIDPCMGSGHILVYAFDVLMQIYESYGYSQRDAAKSIVENNIYGLDIDDRAFQLAYFAIMMKARSYNRRFLTLEIEPNLCAIQESNGLQYDKDMGDFLLNEEHRETLKYLLNTFVDAKEYGSILNVEKRDYDGFLEAWKLTAEATLENVVMMLWYNECNQIVPVLAKQAKLLSAKYRVAITNPPYMAISGGNAKLNNYVKEYYFDSKTDMFAVFIERLFKMVMENGYTAMITQHAWMFLSSYEKLRQKMKKFMLINMAHLGTRAFDEIAGEVVQTTSFVYKNNKSDKYVSTFKRLVDYAGETKKEIEYHNEQNTYFSGYERFELVGGAPLVYWAHDSFFNAFKTGKLVGEIAEVKRGMTTSDNNRFLRFWAEVDYSKIGFGMESHEEAYEAKKVWFPYSKGGGYRKWYGYQEFVVDWEDKGKRVIDFAKTINKSYTRTIVNMDYYFMPSVGFSYITSGPFSMRWIPKGFIYDSGGPGMFGSEQTRKRLIACMNSKPAQYILKLISPTINLQIADIVRLPFLWNDEYESEIFSLVDENILISKEDWNNYETSWEFKRHPYLKYHEDTVESAATRFNSELLASREKLQRNEERLNEIFIDIYSMEDVLTKDTSDLSISEVDECRDIRTLIMYAVGCIFGRYSLEKDGIYYAGGDINWDDKELVYWSRDNIVPILDEEYFSTDIVGLFIKWLQIAFSKEHLEENLDYIASKLTEKGDTSREIIRNYFLKSFMTDHIKMYQKRPIYWQFDSGKQNGFKALVYMHRYNEDTIGNVRIDYLHKIQRIYESEIARMQDIIDNGNATREITNASKQKEKLQKQYKECQEYDEKIANIALLRRAIELDDGVKVNYEKVQLAHDGKALKVLFKL